MVNLKENRPDSTGLARADLSTMTAPPGKKVGAAFADDWIAKTKAQIAKHKADKEKEKDTTHPSKTRRLRFMPLLYSALSTYILKPSSKNRQ